MSNIDNHITITEILHQNISKPYNVLQWEPVRRQMTYPDFVATFPRAERIKHCNFAEIKKDVGHTYATGKTSGQGSKNAKAGQILGPKRQRDHAVENLKKLILDKYNIELIGLQTLYVHLCHLCTHNSHINEKDSTKHTCTNAMHVYFGTASENTNDIDNAKHNSQFREKCPHCEFESTGVALTGNHIPACHFNPTSHNYLKPILRNDTKKLYRRQGLGHKLIELELMINNAYNQRYS